MTPKQAAGVVLKGLGIYWLVEGIFSVKYAILLPFTMRFTDFAKQTGDAVFYIEEVSWVLHAAIYSVLGLTFLFRTQSIIRLARFQEVGADENPGDKIPDGGRYEALAFALIGIYFALPAIAGLVPIFVKFWQLRQPGYSPLFESYLEHNWENLINNGVQAVLGVLLILGRSGLVRLWKLSRPMADDGRGAA